MSHFSLRPVRLLIITGFLSVLPLLLGAAEHPKKKAEHPASEHPKSAEHPSAKAKKSGAEHPVAMHEDAPVLGVSFHADWCGTCKVLAPKMAQVKGLFSEGAIRFVKMDLTNDTTKAEAAAKADALGIREIYNAHHSTTGFVLLLDAANHEVLSKLTADMSPEQLDGAMHGAVAKASKGRHPLSSHNDAEHPKAEHPKAEHPKAEHPKAEHPKAEHPKAKQPKP